MGLLAFLVAFVLGGAHAVAPGHGKTIMAAYLVGARGRMSQALTVAATVAATHTLGVLALGVVLATSLTLAPQHLYEWLRLASGVLVAAVGAQLLRGALRAVRARKAGLADTHFHAHAESLAQIQYAHATPTTAAAPHSHGEHPHDHEHSHPHPHSDHPHPHPHSDHPHPHSDGEHTHTHDEHEHEHGEHEHEHGEHGHGDHDHSHAGEHGHGHRHDGQEHAGPRTAPAEIALLDHRHDQLTEPHSHGGGRPHTHYVPAPDEPFRVRTLLAMGFAGGLSPSPSAVVVLLGAAALGRAWYGVLLVLAYGIGLAAVLTGIGLALARWGERLRAVGSGRVARLLTHRLPTVTAAAILVVGLGMAAYAVDGLLTTTG